MYIRTLVERIARDPENSIRRLEARFGSLEDALNMDCRELQTLLPREKELDSLMALTRHLARYAHMEAYSEHPFLPSLGHARAYLEACYVGTLHERCYVLCLNRQFQLIRRVDVGSGSAREVAFYLRKLGEEALRCQAEHVILSHNHPSGLLHFSVDDLHVTERANHLLGALNVHLLDHILVSPMGSCSMRNSELFAEDFWAACRNPEAVRAWLSR